MRLDADANFEVRRRPSVLPWVGLLFFGSAALGAFFLIVPALQVGPYYRVGLDRSPFTYGGPVLLLLLPYGLALLAWRRGARLPIWWLLAGALVLHGLVLFAPPPQSQDLYQYLFYGRMQSEYGANPLVVPPDRFWTDPWFAWTRWHDQTSVYGPVWMAATFLATAVARDSLPVAVAALKSLVLALDLAVMWMIVAAARLRPDPHGAAGWGLLAFAWNPLVLLSVPLAGAVDVALGAALVGALLARRRGRVGLATALLAGAALIKAYAIVGLALHLVLLVREGGRRAALRHAAGAGALAALAYAPYWRGLETFSGLWDAADLAGITITGVFRRLITPVIGALGPGSGAVAAEVGTQWLVVGLLAAALVWAARRVRDEGSLWLATVAVLVASLYITPWFNYWYIVAPLALVAVLPRNALTDPVLTFAGTSLVWVSFSPQPLAWLVQVALRYGPPAMVLRLQRRRTAAPGPVPSAEALPGPMEEPPVTSAPVHAAD